MRNGPKNRLKLVGMLALLITSLAVFGILAVVGMETVPYLVVPLFIALLVWGLFRVYNGLMRQAERAYLESKKARERSGAAGLDREQATSDKGRPRRQDKPG